MALLRNARREALIVVVVWIVATIWVVGYCWVFGFTHPSDSWIVRSGIAPADNNGSPRTIAGFPGWVFVGIVVPWIACTAFAIYFSLWGMTDDDLGEEMEEESGHGH